MKKLLLLAAVFFSFSALSFAKAVNPVKDVKKSAYEIVKLDDSNTSDILAAAGEPAKQKIQQAIQNGAETAVVEDGDLIIIIIIWDDGSVDVIIIDLR